jgi:DNA-binding NtrC family response regulator
MQAVESGKLREDLLYRLNVFPIEVPPLRNRLSDVPLLAEHFLRAIAQQEGKAKRFMPIALERLSVHHWPGNVRELRNAVQRAYVMASDEWIDEEWLPQPAGDGAALPAAQALAAREAAMAEPGLDAVTLPIGTSMAQAERSLILATLRHYEHHKERTAAALGISLKTLYNRLKEYAAEEAREGSTEVAR